MTASAPAVASTISLPNISTQPRKRPFDSVTLLNSERLSTAAMAQVAALGFLDVEDAARSDTDVQEPPDDTQADDKGADDTSADDTGADETPIGEAPKEKTADEVFLRSQRILDGRGHVTLDFGQFYSKTHDRQLAAFGPGVGLATIEQDTFTSFLLGRYGLADDTEIFASTTYSHQESTSFVGVEQLASATRSGFGPVRMGLRRTVLQQGPGVLPQIFDGGE